jgi:hypothetical protein
VRQKEVLLGSAEASISRLFDRLTGTADTRQSRVGDFVQVPFYPPSRLRNTKLSC